MFIFIKKHCIYKKKHVSLQIKSYTCVWLYAILNSYGIVYAL